MVEVVRNLEFFVLGRLLWLLDFLSRRISMVLDLELVLVERLDVQGTDGSIFDHYSDQIRDPFQQITQSLLLRFGDVRLEEDPVAPATVFCDNGLDPTATDGAKDRLVSSNVDYIGMLRVRITPVF